MMVFLISERRTIINMDASLSYVLANGGSFQNVKPYYLFCLAKIVKIDRIIYEICFSC